MNHPRISTLIGAWLITAGLLSAFETRAQAQEPVREIEITVVPGRLMFSPSRIVARPGEQLRFKVTNTGELMHNFVICDQSGSAWKEVANMVIDLGETALARDFNPGPPLVTYATPLLSRGEEAVLNWRAPGSEDVYSYLSSVPGHASLMRGQVTVTSAARGLSNLEYKYYEGMWENIPDFSDLKAIESGTLKGDRIDFGEIPALSEERRKTLAAGTKAGIVITGELAIPFMGNYTFEHRGKSPSRLTVGDQGDSWSEMDDGTYRLVLEVIGEGALETPAVAMRGPAGVEFLSAADFTGMSWPDEFVIEPGGEPLAVSVPMPDASALALAVALPGEVNYCFDPETLSVRYAWTGRFLDARPAPGDGSGRVGGNCAPLGKIVPLGGNFGFPLCIGKLAADASSVRYLGHTNGSGSAGDEPELLFQVGDHTVAQKIEGHRGAGDRIVLDYTFRIDPAPAPDIPVMFYADSRQVEVTSPKGFARDGVVLFTLPEGEHSISVSLSPKADK